MISDKENTIDIAKIIRILINSWRIIIFGTFFCMVIAAVYSLIIPNVYEASATLLVMPPKFQTELAPSILSIPAYQTILESKENLSAIIKRLGLDKDKMKIEDLQKSLKTKLTMEENGLNQRNYAPVIQLIAQAKSPKQAADIANTWAEIFLENNKKITNHETELSYDFLTDQFSQTTSSLQDTEENLRDYKDNHKEELIKSQLESLKLRMDGSDKINIIGYRQIYIDLKYELDTKISKRNQLRKLIMVQENDGEWIGYLKPQIKAKDIEKELIDITRTINDSTAAQICREVLLAKKDLLQAQEGLQDFLNIHKIDMLRTQFNQGNQELSDNQIELQRDGVRLESLDTSVKVIRKQLEGQDKYIKFSKTISDTALWNRIAAGNLSPEDLEKLSKTKLESEEINPVYLGLVRQMIDLEVELNTLRPKAEGLKIKIKSVDSTIRILDTQLKVDEQQREQLENRLSIAKANYDAIADKYKAMKSDLISTEVELNTLKPKVVETEATVKQLMIQMTALQSELYQVQMKTTQLERNVSYYTTTYQLLADKVEKAKIAKAEVIEDIKFASRAVEPQKRVWPKRSIIVLFSGLAGFLISCFYVFASNSIQPILQQKI